MNRFVKYYPCKVLRPYIKYFAISESDDEGIYRVLPDTSIVIGFQYKGRLADVKDGQETLLSTAGITGLQKGFKQFKNRAGTGSVLVYFTETGAPFFYTFPVHELFAASVPMDCFDSPAQIREIEDRLADACTDKARIEIVQRFFIERLRNITADALVANAVHHIYHSKGTIRIGQMVELLNTSQSPLEKRFRHWVGTSPKKFASIVRFQSLLHSYTDGESLTKAAYNAGYYDQAHFIKDFKGFTGDTPEKFFCK